MHGDLTATSWWQQWDPDHGVAFCCVNKQPDGPRNLAYNWLALTSDDVSMSF